MPDFAGSMPLTHLQPEARAAAARYMTRTGNADVLAVLGLDDLMNGTTPDQPQQPKAAGRD
ncbi:hypothetical protein ACWKSP_26360 [Micromonosporaceae bacterium Da 78-11]